MSISMCENEGVPSVITMCLAAAASTTRSDSVSAACSLTRVEQLLCAGLLEGHRPLAQRASRAGSLSIPITLRPRSANDSASGRPTRPRPITETSALVFGSGMGSAEVIDAGVRARRGGGVFNFLLTTFVTTICSYNGS